MGTLYLIRHGKTQANEKRLYCGATDLPLSENGRRELENISYIVPENCRYIISGMVRTRQTLEILFGKVSYYVDERFREIDFGDFEMKSYEELKETLEYQIWLSGDNIRNVPPNGESGEQMMARVLSGMKELLETTEPIVLVTHGGVIAAIMQNFFPEEGKNRYQWQPKPGGGYVMENGSYKELGRDEEIV